MKLEAFQGALELQVEGVKVRARELIESERWCCHIDTWPLTRHLEWDKQEGQNFPTEEIFTYDLDTLLLSKYC
jgi:hypothetical protein